MSPSPYQEADNHVNIFHCLAEPFFIAKTAFNNANCRVDEWDELGNKYGQLWRNVQRQSFFDETLPASAWRLGQ
jgi:hypothetical protein